MLKLPKDLVLFCWSNEYGMRRYCDDRLKLHCTKSSSRSARDLAYGKSAPRQLQGHTGCDRAFKPQRLSERYTNCAHDRISRDKHVIKTAAYTADPGIYSWGHFGLRR